MAMPEPVKIWIEKNDNKIVIFILFFSIGLAITTWFIKNFHGDARSESFTSDIVSEEANYVRFVYIGSSGCGFSNHPTTHHMVKELKEYFRSLAHQYNYRFISTGIAIDPSAKRGADFLSNSGVYDEMITGLGWFNLGAYQYIWDTLPGQASVPQVVLTSTMFQPVVTSRGFANIHREDRVLERVYGLAGIEELHERTQVSTNDEMITRLGIETQRLSEYD